MDEYDYHGGVVVPAEDEQRMRELNLCPSCVMQHPCLCDRDRAVAAMREYYEANRRTLFRREPKGMHSWGEGYDMLMTELYHIATRRTWE